MNIRAVAASALGNTFVMLVLFFLLFPVLAPALLWALRVVLESINGL